MTFRKFYTASSEEEAVRIRSESEGRVRFVAGCTDLLCEDDPGEIAIDVRRALDYLRRDGDDLVIGAATRVGAIDRWQEGADADDGLLRKCARDFASHQIRNMATVGGNLASAVPSADFAPPLLVLNSRCVIAGPSGRREVSLHEFFTGPHQSILGDDLLVEIRFKAPGKNITTDWRKIGRNPGDIASINAATLLEWDGSEVRLARIALGAVAPTPIHADEAEKIITGGTLSEDVKNRAAVAAQQAASPISDQRASAEYRAHMCGVLTKRMLGYCAEQRGGQ